MDRGFFYGLVLVLVLSSFIEFYLFPSPFARNSDCVRHCMYSEAFHDGFIKARGIPYILFYFIPFLCNELALRVYAVLVATLFYVLGYMVYRNIWRALLIVFVAEPVWLLAFAPLTVFQVWNKLAYQPGRIWLWFRPWSLSLLILLLYMYLWNRRHRQQWLKVPLLGLAYHFHPPMTAIFLLFEDVATGAIVVLLNSLIYMILDARILLLLSILVLIALFGIRLLGVQHFLENKREGVLVAYIILMPLIRLIGLPSLPWGRFTPLFYIASNRINEKAAKTMLILSIPSWTAYMIVMRSLA